MTLQKAIEYLNKGAFIKAEQLLKHIPEKNNDYFTAISTLATIAYEHGHNEKAVSYLLKAEALAADNDSVSTLGLATLYKAQDDLKKSLKVLAKAYIKYPNDNAIAAMYAEALSSNKEYKAAKKIIEKLNRMFPDQASILLALGDINEKVGELKIAIKYFQKAIKIDLYCISAYIKIVAFNGWKPNIFDINVLENITDSCALPIKEIALVHNSLGTIYEISGDYDLAMTHYKKCNKIYRKFIPEHLITAPWTVDKIKNTYTPGMFEFANTKKQSPLIFVFGMPRSGSTLVEQILINNPDVETLGEFRGIGAEIESLGKRIGDDLTEDTFPKDPSELGDQYLQSKVGEVKSKFIIDKMPSNHNYIGLLYLLFPNAKFVYTCRNPAAVCFSNWTTLYREGHQYSYTLKEMVKQYKFHEELMNFWLSALPGKIHTVQYEDVITDFDTTVSALCDYIDIDYTAPMRNFHMKKRKVETASVGQVTEPLYTRSLDRVSKFGSQLNELKELLN